MPGDYLPNDLKALWEELSTHPVQLTPDQLRREAQKVRTGVHRRSMLGGGACLIVAVAWTVFFFEDPNRLQRIGSVFTVLGAIYMFVQLRMRPAPLLPDFGQSSSIFFYRAELERQRDFHRGKWFWSRLLVLLPGLPVWYVGLAQVHPEIKTSLSFEFAAILILAVVSIPLNLRLAGKYQRRIDALDASLRDVSLRDDRESEMKD